MDMWLRGLLSCTGPDGTPASLGATSLALWFVTDLTFIAASDTIAGTLVFFSI